MRSLFKRQFLPSSSLLLMLGLGAGAQPRIAPAAPCPAPITLSSGATSITIDAGEQWPRLTSLHLRGHGGWLNQATNPLPTHVEINGVVQPVRWHLQDVECRQQWRQVQIEYVSDSPRLRLLWQWQARSADGPLEHTISIRNLGSEPLSLPLVPSLRFAWLVAAQTPLQRFWVEKGADTPSAEGTHDDALLEGDAWEGTSSTYARPMAHRAREMIPLLLVRETRGERRGWYLGIEFSGRTHITLVRQGTALLGEAGLNPAPDGYRTRLLPRQVFSTPTVFLGSFRGDADDAGNILRRWVRTVLGNARTLSDPSYPLMVSNSWGSGMAVDEALARRMIADAKSLGLEMFHLDAGWFRGVGDWQSDPVKFPHGVNTIADYAHGLGLKFGLWVDWTQAGVSTEPGALNVNDPQTRDWLVADPPAGWQHREPFKGITIDLGVPAAQDWASRELERLVGENHLDMLEHDGYLVAQGSARADHPAEAPDPSTLRVYEDSGFLWAADSNDTDVSYFATRAYYAIYEQLRRRHPTLLLELCNDGGRMIDFGSAAHGDYFSITDSYDPLSNRRAFYDASYVLPPAMLETYVENWAAPHLANLRYMLRSGMLGWFSLMLDTGRWNQAQRTAARAEIVLYKSALRPLIRAADLYHVAPRADGVGWDGIEYYARSQRRGVLYAFRGSAPDQPGYRFRLRGLEPHRSYRLRFHDRGTSITVSGAALMRRGFEVHLPEPLSSELVFIATGR